MVKKFFKKFIGNTGNNHFEYRHTWVKNTLKNLASGKRILDAGAGERRYFPFCEHLNYVSQDFNQYNGMGDGSGLQTGNWDTSKIDIVGDITSIPENDATFDAILCTEVFEHIPDPISACKEFSRLLKPGGELIITAPFASLTHFAPFHFYTGFNRYFYEYHLTNFGFKIIEMTPNGDYSEFIASEIRRLSTFYGKAPFLIKFSLSLLLRYISIRGKKIDSSELCCVGYHIRAVKL